MPESNTKSPSDNSKSDFVLKHRIAGAAFLLFFGALFLPWLLGAPDSGLKAKPNTQNEQPSSINSKNVEQTLVSALADEQIANQEQVYISKITPLDAERKRIEDDRLAEEATANQAKTLESLADEDDPDSNTDADERVTAQVVKESTKEASNNTAIIDDVKPEQKTANEGASTTTVVKQSTAVDSKRIDVGWMVQVGVFTDKRGAGRVVEDLRSKGFSPSTSIVDTNRGKNTGTRIWLGPFAQRVDAAKAKNFLTEKTGEAGFIRAYP